MCVLPDTKVTPNSSLYEDAGSWGTHWKTWGLDVGTGVKLGSWGLNQVHGLCSSGLMTSSTSVSPREAFENGKIMRTSATEAGTHECVF